ncbi:putative cell adhesion molecule [Nephila pilipes]|uniref:Putative cell adhesion molecule n=2 Tax=Nephilidae TaxID=450948 RepID=A0A8X6TYR4_NEPPI|nr:putative cell adhesion molecule [Nephila pilipes]
MFLFPGIHAAQQFEIKPSNIEVNPGDTAVLTCKVHNRQGECAWLKDGKVMGKIDAKYEFSREPPDGDCSIRIRNAKIEEDDGMWQCQVTQIALTDPTLTAPEVKFTVREPPMPPKIEDNTNLLPAGDPYPTQAGKPKRLHCISRKGNPPAKLKWFIEDTDITSMSNQTNNTDVDKPKTWQAVSVLDYVFQKDHNGKMLKCVAIHAAYETLTKEIRIPLEVLYLPEIRLEGQPVRDIEEGESVSVKCVVDANPQANVIWKKSGYSSIYALKDQIEFMPVKRSDSGVYSCSATNDVGTSHELEVNIDVKYKPQILNVSPIHGATVAVYNSTTLVCEAEGNPPPKYSWLQKMGGDGIEWQQRGNTAVLLIQNVTYQYQGQYVCEASNVINGHTYKSTSAEISLDVTGAPQVLTDTARTKKRVVVEKDEDAVIAVYFCSDPSPKRTFWEWGSIKLESGEVHIRYIAERLHNDEGAKDCYEARLIVRGVDGSDSRKYTLNVENERGSEAFAVALEVREPVAMSVVIGIVVGCIILLLIITLVILYLLKAERMCFNRKGFKPESSESDAESGRSAELIQNGRSKPGAIPPDALYTANKRDSSSPDNRPLYENIKPDKNDNRNEASLVYASLDLPNPVPQTRNGHSSKPKHNPPPRRDRTEYAEIQFQPKVYEQASL